MTNNTEGLSKKDRKKQAKLAKAKRNKQSQVKRNVIRILSIVLVVAVVGYAGYRIVDGILSRGSLSDYLATANESDWTKGPDDARNVLIKYSDFQCPACARSYPIVDELVESGEDVQVIYRFFPLTSVFRNSFAAATAAEAAGRQGKFWEMHDALFDNQSDWSNLDVPENAFIAYAEEIGLDIEQFRSDMNSSEVRQKINANIAAGQESGVRSTPSFVLNGKFVGNPGTKEGFLSLLK